MPKSKQSKNSKAVKLSAIDEDLLTVLTRGELYGLEILDDLNVGRPITLSFGSLYPALNRLESKGLVTWRWGGEQDESGGARRKYYKITSLGASALSEIQAYRAALAMRAAQGQAAFGGA